MYIIVGYCGPFSVKFSDAPRDDPIKHIIGAQPYCNHRHRKI